MSRSVKSTTSKARTGLTAGTASSNRHFSKQVVIAPTKEALQMQLREFDFRVSSWPTVEAKFRELYSLLSAPTSGLNAAQERIQQKENVSSSLVTFLDMCQAECRRLLAEGKERQAVEGGLTTLNLKREYYGNNSLQLVSAFFHLARTNQCLGHVKRAEEFLSLAQLQIMRHPEADASLKAELHQIYGLLYASDGRQDQALKHLTCAAYYLGQLNGPEHILTSFCYFDLGNVFAALNHMENTMAFYEKVKDIWYVFLSGALQRMVEIDRRVRAADDEEAAAAIAANAERDMKEYATSAVGADNVQDAAKMLQAIVLLQRDRFGVVHPLTGRSELIHGMLLLWTGERTPAYETLVRANEISRRCNGERHEVTLETAALLQSFGMELPSDAALSVDELIRDIEQQKAAADQQQYQQQPNQQQQQQHFGGSASATAQNWQPSATADIRAAAQAAVVDVDYDNNNNNDPDIAAGVSPPTDIQPLGANDATTTDDNENSNIVGAEGAGAMTEGTVHQEVVENQEQEQQQQQEQEEEETIKATSEVESHQVGGESGDVNNAAETGGVPEVETFEAEPLGVENENENSADVDAPQKAGEEQEGEVQQEGEQQPEEEEQHVEATMAEAGEETSTPTSPPTGMEAVETAAPPAPL